MLLAAILSALLFTQTGAPGEIPVTPTFPLAGYISDTNHTLTKTPLLDLSDPITPYVRISFVAPQQAEECLVGLADVFPDMGPRFGLLATVVAPPQGQRVFVTAALPRPGYVPPNAPWWADKTKDHYTIEVECGNTQGAEFDSQFYTIKNKPTKLANG